MIRGLFAFFLLAAALVASSALQAAPPLVSVTPVGGAPEPMDGRIAAEVTKALERAGMSAGNGDQGASYQLAGVAKAKAEKTGTRLAVNWTLRRADGTSETTLPVSIFVPYQAGEPWDAIDMDSLKRLAAATADAVEAHFGEASGGVPLTANDRSDPEARPPGPPTRVFLKGVTGAPGDGNVALAQALAEILLQFDVVFVPAPIPEAFVIRGEVVVVKEKPAQDRVGILWLLEDMKGRELARVEQDNPVPAGSLASRWGQVALFAAEGAADGLLTAMGDLGPPGRR